MSSYKEFVLTSLRKKDIPFIITQNKKNVDICCVFDQHERVTGKPDNRPSLSISLLPEIKAYHCWSCGASGHINNLLISLKLPEWKTNTIITAKELFQEKAATLREQVQASQQIYKKPYNLEPWPLDKTWRKLPGDFLRGVGAKRWYDEEESMYRILFTIRHQERAIGHIAGITDQRSRRKWKNSPGSWVKEKGLFPLEYVFRNKIKTLCLVEGPYDALKMNYNGIPALAFLGTYNWSSLKEITLFANGIQSVFLCMDGDKAGYSTAERIYKTLAKRFNVVVVDLPEDEDPGTLYKEQLAQIKKVVQQYEAGVYKTDHIDLTIGETYA